MTADQNSNSGSNAASSGEGFIGSQGSGSDDYLQDNGSSSSGSTGQLGGSSGSSPSGGSDLANQGRGALDDQESDSNSGSSPSEGSDGSSSS
jgi:hypothetical protein